MVLTIDNLKIIFGGAGLVTKYGITAEKAEEILKALKQEGIRDIDGARRFSITYHSYLKPEHGDAIIIGSKYRTQLATTLAYLKNGPLCPEDVDRVNDLWKVIGNEAILDNFNNFIPKQSEYSTS
ncbi:aldehyde reductase (GliO), putative [Paecilomyces variotii No. 5]|uniref:Aldehyde reductase (GliO), putative n=1 Tax=Byssochlamys spectabilis (strain No. 5 / NBRC 109023) TaxID=1356009 RepID=V5FYJ4_BYSSN|nr:aldehyde reductase (GliO), putative [Paecilomyces variotii No. 5]